MSGAATYTISADPVSTEIDMEPRQDADYGWSVAETSPPLHSLDYCRPFYHEQHIRRQRRLRRFPSLARPLLSGAPLWLFQSAMPPISRYEVGTGILLRDRRGRGKASREATTAGGAALRSWLVMSWAEEDRHAQQEM